MHLINDENGNVVPHGHEHITAMNIRMDIRMNMDAAIVVITSVREAVQKK